MSDLLKNAHYIEVSAQVRYWEDTFVNGVVDAIGDLIPCRKGDLWKPIIKLCDGMLCCWKDGYSAEIHYKVADAGMYWLLDENKNRIAKWRGFYVPDNFLCHDDNGYGDYIIFNVNDGFIDGYVVPEINVEYWYEPNHS